MRLYFALLGLCLATLGACTAWAAPRVVIVSSERDGAYLQASQALVGELARNGVNGDDVLALSAAEVPASAPLNPRLFVALGVAAAKVLLDADVRAPVLCALLPRNSFEQLMSRRAGKPAAPWSALYLDQPWSRQIGLIHLAFPQARHIAVLWGPESQQAAPSLRRLATAQGLELLEVSAPSAEQAFEGLHEVLRGASLLLAVPDAQVYNANSIQHILLASFRARVPMMAFSPAYVRAGALLALYVTPAQVGAQAAAMVLDVLRGQAMPPSQYSRDFTVSVNEHVARSLGLSLDQAALRLGLQKKEDRP